MQPFSSNPAAAYRRVDLEARIEASANADLTRICLEEAVSATGQALMALNRDPETVPSEALARAHSIALYLARSVSPENPLRSALMQFYGGQAEAIGRNMKVADAAELERIRDDFSDLLAAA